MSYRAMFKDQNGRNMSGHRLFANVKDDERLKLLRKVLDDAWAEAVREAPRGKRVAIPQEPGRDLTMCVIMQAVSIAYLLDIKMFIGGESMGQSIVAVHKPEYRAMLLGIGLTSTRELITTFCHELSHHVQHMVYGYKHPAKSFEDCQKYEREACRLSYYVYVEFFSHFADIPHQAFRCYQSAGDLEFLARWWAKYSPRKFRMPDRPNNKGL